MGKRASQLQNLPLTQQRLLCANLADPVPTDAARGRNPVVAGATGMSAGHRPPPAACSCGAALVAVPGLSAEHGPLRVARSRDLAAPPAFGLLAGHGSLRATHGRGLVAAAELRWTCGLDSSAGSQR
ncbi:unnamed protein product [Sphagnum troendelagicum]|uniref:Uncharacterized protein n=1 Tax=Sphagnum troendelagicum TaxID=128251 RepID=A0ABP0UH33_9BRYO